MNDIAISHLLSKGRDRDFVVVSGHVPFGDEIKGSEENDWTYVDYELHISVGPFWDVIGKDKGDVCPIDTIAGYHHASPDTADSAVYGINFCGWTVPDVPSVQKKLN
ncbi:MAG TPA: hypothetical protein VF884_06380 [Nitrososphaeraceae archaeon]